MLNIHIRICLLDPVCQFLRILIRNISTAVNAYNLSLIIHRISNKIKCDLFNIISDTDKSLVSYAHDISLFDSLAVYRRIPH